MIGFAAIAAGGGPSSVGAMTDHLLNATLSQEGNRLAAYYSRGGESRDVTFEVAQAVVAGEMTMREGVDVLMEDWDANNPAPGRTERDALLAEGGWGPDRSADEAFARLADDWNARRHAAEAAVDYRLDVLTDRMDKGLLDAPLAIVRPDIDPRVLLGLGIQADGILSHDEINALLSGRRADGQKVAGKHYAVARRLSVDPKTGEIRLSIPNGSYDFCPTPDKSVSVAWAFAPAVEQAQIYHAHIEAAREAVGSIATEVGKARFGNGGKGGTEAGHVGWLEFTHHTSRRTMVSIEDGEIKIDQKGQAGDPDLHTHFLMPNAVFTASGRVGSLDTGAIGGFIFEADAFYHARLAQKLRDAGFATELDPKTGAVRMPAVPDDVRILFSKRTQAGELIAMKEAADRGEAWDEMSAAQKEARIKRATQSPDQKIKGDKDPKADFLEWKRQAKEVAGWEPSSLQLYGPPKPELSVEQRHRVGYDVALPFLADRLEHKAVVTHWDARVAAARGLIEAGIDGVGDIDAVTRIMRAEGVQQYGETTALVWGVEEGRRYTSVTTALHETEEREFIRLAQAASDDRSAALPSALLGQKISESGLDLSGAHGKAQRSAIERVGTGGKFSLILAAAGAGKTTSLRPLTAALKQQGRAVYGASLAWRQADDMVDAGIDPRHVKAFSVLIDGIRDGSTKVGPTSVVAVDEWGLLGTRQALELLRLREIHGFTVIALGDNRQAQAIQAGAIIDLSRRALGAEQVPEILTTLRQQTERERLIVGLFREGRAAEALTMKRSDGTAEMAFGGYNEAVDRVAKLYAARLKATGEAPTISAPTNSDAHRIGAAVRTERRAMGLLGPDIRTVKATDGERDYDLALATGDRVRLFKSIGAGGRGGNLGRNGSVLEVVDVTDRGVILKSRTGKVGEAAWETLNKNGRVQLAYGDVMTIHTAQGSTAREHIFALPAGSQAIDGNLGYSANTRHRHAAYIVTSETAERVSVRKHRPINDVREVTVDDKWAAVAKALAYQPDKDTALAMFGRVEHIRRGAVRAFQKTLQPAAQQRAAGQAPSMGHEVATSRKVAAGLAQDGAALMQRIAVGARAVRRQVQRLAPQQRPGPQHEYRGPSIGR